MTNNPIKLLYTILCDDVRLEVGNKITLIGIFETISVAELPFSLIKFAVVNHWEGEGRHISQVRVLSEDGTAIVASTPTTFNPSPLADNIDFFINVTFPSAGRYIIQTLLDSEVVSERELEVKCE